jgi:hypothetical protein
MSGEEELDGEVGSAFTDAMSVAQGEQPQATPDVPPEAPPEAPQQPDYSDLVGLAQQVGMRVDGNVDPAQMAREALAELQRQRPYVDYARQIAPHAQEFNAYLQQRTQAQQPQPTQQPQQNEFDPDEYLNQQWGAPGWSPNWDEAVRRGVVQQDPDSGLYVAAQGYEVATASLVAEMNQARAAQLAQWQQLGKQNPYQSFYKAVQEPLRRQWQNDVKSEIEKYFSQQRTQTAIEQFESQNAGWLYSQDAFGNVSASQDGQRLFDELRTLQDAGVQDPQTRLNIALRSTGLAAKVSGLQSPQQVPAQAAPQAAPVANQAATPGQQPFLRSALERASHAPQMQPGVGQTPPAESVLITEGELKNMFANEFRRTRGA